MQPLFCADEVYWVLMRRVTKHQKWPAKQTGSLTRPAEMHTERFRKRQVSRMTLICKPTMTRTPPWSVAWQQRATQFFCQFNAFVLSGPWCLSSFAIYINFVFAFGQQLRALAFNFGASVEESHGTAGEKATDSYSRPFPFSPIQIRVACQMSRVTNKLARNGFVVQSCARVAHVQRRYFAL